MRAVIEEIEEANSGRSVESIEFRADNDNELRDRTSKREDWEEEMLERGLLREE